MSCSSAVRKLQPSIRNSSNLVFVLTYECQSTSEQHGKQTSLQHILLNLIRCYVNFSPLLFKLGRIFVLCGQFWPSNIGNSPGKRNFQFLLFVQFTLLKEHCGSNFKIQRSRFSFHFQCFVLHWPETEPVFVPNLSANLLAVKTRHSKAEHPDSLYLNLANEKPKARANYPLHR